MTEGEIFDIQRFAVHDGPGIRTLVFFKGCPLRCQWCANPEGLKRGARIMVNLQRCTGSARCLDRCPRGAISIGGGKIVMDRGLCNNCGECVDACPNDALRVVGKMIDDREVLQEVLKDKPFYERSGGGLTLSGGGPLSQPAFAASLLRMSKGKGVNTVVETCGQCEWKVLEQLLPYTDLFLYDLKHMDDAKHKEYTGVGNTLILENAKALVSNGGNVRFRIPLVPGRNDAPGNLEATASFIKGLGHDTLVILPYHRFGVDKYRQLGMPAPPEIEPPSKEHLSKAIDLFKKSGVSAIIE